MPHRLLLLIAASLTLTLSLAYVLVGDSHASRQNASDKYSHRPAKIKNADVEDEGGVQCSVDGINQRPTSAVVVIAKNSPFIVSGWVYVESDWAPVTPLVYVMLTSGTTPARYFEATRIARPDVATALNNSLLVNSGFVLKENIADLPAGEYKLNIVTGKRMLIYVCHTDIVIKVKE